MMMQVKETARIRFTSFLLSAAMLVASGFAIGVVAQETRAAEAGRERSELSAAVAIRFRKYEPPRADSEDESPVSRRFRRFRNELLSTRRRKLAAMNARMPAPKPTTALLLSEIQVIGISRSPRGYAAIVEATPIKLSYVIYPGEPFFDGQLVAIEDNRLVFRRETVFTDGRRERAVEYKPLRQPTPVNSMTAPANPSVATANP